jgi:hypothetical protein
MCYYGESGKKSGKDAAFRRSFPGESFRGMAGKKKKRFPKTLERVKNVKSIRRPLLRRV